LPDGRSRLVFEVVEQAFLAFLSAQIKSPSILGLGIALKKKKKKLIALGLPWPVDCANV